MTAPGDDFVAEVSLGTSRVALLRCYPSNGLTVVSGEVVPVGGGETVRRGPHTFTNAADAHRFVDETLLAFQYLGCQIERRAN